MNSRLRPIFAVLCFACFGLLIAGCDSGSSNSPPEAKFSVDMNSRNVTFDASGSQDSDGSVQSYEWEFGDGGTATGETVSHTYASPGKYTATLTVTDDSDVTDSTSTDVDLSPTTFEIKIQNVGPAAPLLKSGAFTTPEGASSAGPAGPGEAYSFSFTAGPNEVPGTGMNLSFATMFVQSNDMFYAFPPTGLPLFDDNGTPQDPSDDTPIGMNSPTDVTSKVGMWDAGTEQDQLPGNGDNQPRAGTGPDTGPDDSNKLVPVQNQDSDPQLEDNGYEYPAVSDAIKVTVSSQKASTGGFTFTVRIENVGGSAQVNGKPLIISPGSYAAHWDQKPNGDEIAYPQFRPKKHDDSDNSGIELIAEVGNATKHKKVLANFTGVTVPLSPTGYAAHTDSIALFATGKAAKTGVERIAEDGTPKALVQSLQGNPQITSGGALAVPEGASNAGPLAPGQTYKTTTKAVPGDRLSIGTMFVQSNDIFYAFQPEGLPLWDNSGSPISGDQTGKLRLYDAGTEADEEPGVGLNQAPRQDAFGNDDQSQVAEGGTIARFDDNDSNGDGFPDNDGFSYPPLLDGDGNPTIIKVTVTPNP